MKNKIRLLIQYGIAYDQASDDWLEHERQIAQLLMDDSRFSDLREDLAPHYLDCQLATEEKKLQIEIGKKGQRKLEKFLKDNNLNSAAAKRDFKASRLIAPNCMVVPNYGKVSNAFAD